MLTIIDFWLLGRLEKFAHWWQKLTGKNCFWLARVFALLGGFFAGYCVAVAYFVFSADSSYAVYFEIASFFLCLEILFIFCAIRVSEMRVSEMQILGLANPSKHIEQFERIWRIVFYPIYTFTWAVAIYFIYHFSLIVAIFCASVYVWIIIAWYFMCCDPLPPSKSIAKEWKEKLVNAVKGIFAPAPQPSPVPCK